MELEGSDMPEASSETSALVPVPASGSMEEDRRKLWLWQPGEWKRIFQPSLNSEWCSNVCSEF